VGGIPRRSRNSATRHRLAPHHPSRGDAPPGGLWRCRRTARRRSRRRFLRYRSWLPLCERRCVVELALRFAFGHRNAAVAFENPDDRDLFVANGVVAPGNSSVFIGSGLDLDAFAFAPEPATPTPLVALPSRLIAEKGVREFVAAARLLKAEGTAARFALVGEGDEGNPRSIGEAELAEWARAGAVECWGWRDDIAKVLREAAIVCLPSYYREGAPRVLMEAAATGRPSVTTDWPGCRHVVIAEETGLLVPVRDVAALAAALRRLIADPALRANMGEAARRHAERNFSNERAAAHMLEIYASLRARAVRRS
jgi:glycosyltransferase involved in cell wall biosynthesis